MPIWEYQCAAGHRSEVLDVSNKSRLPSIPCPYCRGRADRVVGVTHWQRGTGSKESAVSAAIRRVQKLDR